eukprot:augustus_masked-scaffold_4-processed-gene-13.1-mRNA-1 protein AED:0.08 eAED:0.08 QI:0/-1/0/1/-1/1/1/0/679
MNLLLHIPRITTLPSNKTLFRSYHYVKRNPLLRVSFKHVSRPYGTNSQVFTPEHAGARLIYLETQANARPDNPNAQARYLASLVNTHPNIVIERVQSGKFANNEVTQNLYVSAIERVSNPKSINSPFSQAAKSFSGDADSPHSHDKPDDGPGYSNDTPLKVEVVPSPFDLRSQLWKGFKFLLLTYIAFSLISSFLEDISLPPQFSAGASKNVKPEISSTKFSDVKGAEEGKKELVSIVSYLQGPEKFTRLGGKPPKGIMLTGPPGTGKTLLAKAVAGEAGVPFFYASGSEFEEVYVGVGAKRIRELFQTAKENAPCIIFIDEIDAIGAKRGGKEPGGLRMTLNQLLVELDGFNSAEGVIMIGATNFPQILDPALVRPGRFDRNIVVNLPDMKDRQDIIRHYLGKLKVKAFGTSMERMVDTLARGTPGLSGADLSNIINIAAVRASVAGKSSVEGDDLEYAKDKVLLGGEASGRVIPEDVRVNTAWHEGGHALVAHFTPGAMPLHKATILPRGPALGMVVQLPEEQDMMQRTKRQLLAELDVCLGGRIAEEIKFGDDDITTGASNDLEKATAIAKSMVKRYGMSHKLGLMVVSEDHSDKEVEEEVRHILDESYKRVKTLMLSKHKELRHLAESLLKYETLDKEEIEFVLQTPNLKKFTKYKDQKIEEKENKNGKRTWFFF